MKDQKVALITGTSKGIGNFLAKHFSSQNYRVFGCSRSPLEEAIDNYQHFCIDVADEVAVRKMFASIRKACGRLDVLVNNAGIASMNHLLLTPVQSVQKILSTNIVGTFICTREAAKLMKVHRYGRIVNFATVATPLKLEGEAIYASSKAAIVSFTQITARELGEYGITVNAVGPTPIKTDLIRSVPPEKIESLIARQSIHRFGEFEDVANVVDFFVDDKSNFVTGQVVYLGGI